MRYDERQLVLYVTLVQLEVEEEDSLAAKTSSCLRREGEGENLEVALR